MYLHIICITDFIFYLGAITMKFFKNILRELYYFDSNASKTNRTLEQELKREIRLRKEINSEHIWSSYYIPIATAEILKQQGCITAKDTFKLECLANSLMFKDMADGKLNEFYRFNESEV